MSRIYSLYDTATGHFTGKQLYTEEARSPLSVPAGTAALEGDYDHLCQRVDLTSGAVVDFQPPSPSTAHAWDAGRQRWRIPEQDDAEQFRARVLYEIQTLEDNQNRALREAALGDPLALRKLKEIDAAIAQLREQLE